MQYNYNTNYPENKSFLVCLSVKMEKEICYIIMRSKEYLYFITYICIQLFVYMPYVGQPSIHCSERLVVGTAWTFKCLE